ncbi:hypothetical protein BDFB_005254 [Asbolus verrucosus]|uniref:Uncharacterized protein n=1 Tax=Asbolus verrucosus TaxID=1661398 RepID=A0A482VF61_ASBVE|nr:hypothetical protein BDFB_005254 [Asbolus verrucosus]
MSAPSDLKLRPLVQLRALLFQQRKIYEVALSWRRMEQQSTSNCRLNMRGKEHMLKIKTVALYFFAVKFINKCVEKSNYAVEVSPNFMEVVRSTLLTYVN